MLSFVKVWRIRLDSASRCSILWESTKGGLLHYGRQSNEGRGSPDDDNGRNLPCNEIFVSLCYKTPVKGLCASLRTGTSRIVTISHRFRHLSKGFARVVGWHIENLGVGGFDAIHSVRPSLRPD